MDEGAAALAAPSSTIDAGAAAPAGANNDATGVQDMTSPVRTACSRRN